MRIHQPDLVIYDAGIDIHQQDDLGLLHISTAGVAERDWYVLSECHKRSIPVAAVIGGGYQRDLSALTQIHLQLFYAAFKISGLSVTKYKPLVSCPSYLKLQLCWQRAFAPVT